MGALAGFARCTDDLARAARRGIAWLWGAWLWFGGRVVWVGYAVTRYDIDRLLGGRWLDQATAFGFQLCPLGGFQRLLGQVAQAGIRVAVTPARRVGSRLALGLGLSLGGGFGALGAFPLVDVVAHPLYIALGLLAGGFRYGFVGAHCDRAATARAGRVRNLGLAARQAAFVDFGTGRLGKQQAGEEGKNYPVHGVVIA